MIKRYLLLSLLALLPAPMLHAADVGSRKVLVGPGIGASELKIKSNTDRQTWAADGEGLTVTVAPGKKTTPTLYISSAGGAWDLSEHGHIEAMITNLEAEPLRFEMRVDNEGDWKEKPWNVEATRIQPGKTMPVKVIFGHHYGYQPGYKLNSAAVKQVALYIEHSEEPRRYRIETIIAGGAAGETPPVNKAALRHTPPEGFILGGAGATLDAAKQVKARKGVTANVIEHEGQSALAVELAGSAEAAALSIVPPDGAWNLSDSTNVVVNFTNTGSAPFTPSLYLQNANKEEATDTFTADAPIAPGATGTITLGYAAAKIWQGPQGDLSQHAGRKGTGGSQFKSDKVSYLELRFAHAAPAQLRVDSIRAEVITQSMPEWLGQRPPVEGDWKLSLSDDFDGDKLNEDVWEPMGPNFWGEKKLTRYSRDNVIMGDGHVRLRMEKRPGWHNDDPETKHHADYAGGVLRTYGKWTQLYGYFEARMKITEKTALWPAFWTMPDRGPAAGEQWKRQDIGKGGMELDIMEHLTRWGPYRYTTAMHWDGYGKNHKATGASVYFNPAPDGYITSGVLWLPGEVTYYVNGKEIAHWKHERIGNVASEILFTMPIGGWDNEKRPVDSELPADFLIDYVRVWQRADFTPGGKP